MPTNIEVVDIIIHITKNMFDSLLEHKNHEAKQGERINLEM